MKKITLLVGLAIAGPALSVLGCRPEPVATWQEVRPDTAYLESVCDSRPSCMDEMFAMLETACEGQDTDDCRVIEAHLNVERF